MIQSILFALVLLATTSCYRMPYENEDSLIPMVNNPDVTKESPCSGMPVGY